MNKKVFFRNFLPLIIALVGAFVFFASYNRYLLDSSLVNLKVSLRKLKSAESISEVKEIEGILDTAFLMESTKGEFDLATALKMEMGEELTEEVSIESQKKNEEYVETMTSAAEIDAATDMVSGISKTRQIEDVKQIIEKVIARKQKKKPVLVSKLEDFIISFAPTKKRGELKDLGKVIAKKKKNLSSYSGKRLQEEYLKIAKLYLRIKDYGNSLVYINKTIKVNPESPQALTARFYSGILYESKKDFKKAQEIFGKIKEDLPKDWEGFSSYQEASSLYAQGETKKAIALFEANFAKDSSQETRQLSQFRAGYSYLYDLKDSAAAQTAFNKLDDKAKNSVYTSYYDKKIKIDLASFHAYQAFRFLEEGYRTLNAEKYSQAIEKFNLALKVYHESALAYSGKSLALQLLDQSGDALKAAKKATQLSSKSANAPAVLGFVYYNLGMIDEAASAYERAVEINSDLDIPNYNLGTMYFLKKDYKKAKKYFRQAIKINPSITRAYNNLGYIAWLEQDYVKAKKLFKQATVLSSDYIEPNYNLGVVLLALGEYEQARKSFTKVEGLQSGYRKTAYYLKMIKKRLGY
jgi:tetratricopeptide (TPR) repeat protein